MQIKAHKNIALVAHDNKKADLIAWVKKNEAQLSKHNFFATGTTGKLVAQNSSLTVTALKSGPLGGDQQIGAKIAEQEVDMLIFFWDPLEAQPHDPDVKALIRLAAVWNIPVACNLSTADFILSSPYFDEPFDIQLEDYTQHNNREISTK